MKIKLLCSWTNSKTITNFYRKYLLNNNFTLVTNEDNVDYYVIFNGTSEFHVPSKSIVFQMEPFMKENPIWGEWCNPKGYYMVCDHATTYNNLEWHLSLSAHELLKISFKKTKIL